MVVYIKYQIWKVPYKAILLKSITMYDRIFLRIKINVNVVKSSRMVLLTAKVKLRDPMDLVYLRLNNKYIIC